MGNFYITVSKGLLEGKHRENLKKSIWLYLWLLDKITLIENGLGYVWGRKPVKYEDIKEDLDIPVRTYRRWIAKLEKDGYIKVTRTPAGLTIAVTKGKKIFNQKVGSAKSGTSDVPKVAHQDTQNGTSNIRQYTRQDNKTITKVITSFGDPDINLVKDYFLKTFSLPKEDCTQKQSRQYWHLLLKESKSGVKGVKWLIDLAKQDDFLAPNITSGKDLYYKRIKLISRKRGSGPKIAVMGGVQ